MKSAYVRIKIHTSYAQRVAAETETEETAKYPQEKDRMKQAMSKSTPKKGRKRIKTKDKPASATQERRQHARAKRILETPKERGGVVAPRRNNRITESATKESREAKVKAKKTIHESDGKRQDERTKTNEKGTRNGTGRTPKRRGKEKRNRKKGEKKRKTARVSGRYYVDYLGLKKGDAS